ncbi:hypothetical protein [Actinomadura sp. WMMB 499]|uniref:hypothetical protein n=1 Tax=Actinomadura sp. WMMB 499 TaxID=1219491 RepID=UPI001243CB79|nr:hypothetical protein [Actinomadura sp. WMMB 499]QFG23441.1 hypothetical protein F7P10_22300 [Actinomadura sp. WMMB 499]
MGGTALLVLTPHIPEHVEPIVVEEMIAEGLTPDKSDPDFWYSADGLPYAYEVQSPDEETEPEELEAIQQATRVTIRCGIVLHIFVSNIAGRPALGRMAHRVAQRTDGWVLVDFYHAPGDVLERLSNAHQCLQVGEIYFMDAEAMAAWLTHPEFHVVK